MPKQNKPVQGAEIDTTADENVSDIVWFNDSAGNKELPQTSNNGENIISGYPHFWTSQQYPSLCFQRQVLGLCRS